ncbi:MAG: hypothetical protein KDE08_08505 [Rhodobacteraceae bacterium]|nr:hypothetical protein [Paracoccaceae bacterium]
MSETFEYIVQARNPGTYFALGVSLAAVDFIWVYGWPLIAEVGAVAFMLLVLHRLVINKKYGFRILSDAIECITRNARSTVPFSDIAGASVIVLHDGSTRSWLNLRGGGIQSLPGVTRVDADRLIREFRRRGIWVSQSPVA